MLLLQKLKNSSVSKVRKGKDMKENIFSNFYTKVLTFFQKDRDETGENTKETAQNRLKLVLMQDRSNLDGAAMQKMREQLIDVISKYIEIDQEALDLNLEADGEEIALMLNIPVLRARTREEIDKFEIEEEEAKKKAIEDAVAKALAEKENENEEENQDIESEDESEDDLTDETESEDEPEDFSDKEEDIDEDDEISEEAEKLKEEKIVPSEDNPFVEKSEKKKKNK